MCNEFRAVIPVFSKNQNQSLLPAVFQGPDLIDEFLIIQRFALGILVGDPKAAIRTIVLAFVSDVQGCKQNDTVSVNQLFKRPGSIFYLLDLYRISGVYQYCNLLHTQSLLRK